MAKMRSKLEATFTASQSDIGVLAALDRDVNDGTEDTPLTRVMRSMSPAEMARRVGAVPDASFAGRPDANAPQTAEQASQ